MWRHVCIRCVDFLFISLGFVMRTCFGTCLMVAVSLEHVVEGLRQTVNNCSPSLLGKLSPRARAYAEAQPDIDASNDEYTPRLANYYYERVRDLGDVELGQVLGRSVNGVVFALSSHPEYVIKFQANCDRHEKAVHPLLMDYWLGVEAAALNVSAKPIFVSPAAPLMGTTGPKVSFGMSEDNFDTCASLGGVVRFMVMERMNSCMKEVFPDPNLGQAIVVGMQAIHLLAPLHQAGIFHGDIHSGNICESPSDPGMLRLIDFGLGGFIDDETNPAAVTKMKPHQLLTEWQLLGCPFSRRDDIYKTIELIATMAIGRSRLWDEPRRWAIIRNEAKLLAWKRTGSLFEPHMWTVPIAELPHVTSEQRKRIITLLNECHSHARQLVNVDTVIPYQAIVDGLRAVYNLIHVGTEVIPTTTAPTTDVSTAASVAVSEADASNVLVITPTVNSTADGPGAATTAHPRALDDLLAPASSIVGSGPSPQWYPTTSTAGPSLLGRLIRAPWRVCRLRK